MNSTQESDLASIRFYSELEKFTFKNKRKNAEWVKRIVFEHQKALGGDINYLFVSKEQMVDYNNKYLNHDYPTDIITFPVEEGLIAGDILVCPEVIKENALSLDENEERELLRVLAHGVLHLIGFNDSTSKEQEVMREREEFCLALHKLYA